jgi:uncharacterized membrane protein YoaK (UPF0700 family)
MDTYTITTALTNTLPVEFVTFTSGNTGALSLTIDVGDVATVLLLSAMLVVQVVGQLRGRGV